MKKKRRQVEPTVVPFGFVDSSRELDSGLHLLSELLLGFGDRDFILEVDAVRELGLFLDRYLRSRNALEVVAFSRIAFYWDNEFLELVKSYKKKLKSADD